MRVSRKLDEVEFELLGGTDFMVHLVRNSRKVIGISKDVLNELYDYLDAHAKGLYYVRTFEGGYKVVIYFEDVMDRENVDQFLRQYSDEEFY
jgi:hypothetical protein